MNDRNHRLEIHTRRESEKVDADCSCGLWKMRNVDRKDACDSHALHLDEYLGPDAREAREGAA